MLLRASRLIFFISFICFIATSVARPKEDDDSETPSETDKDSPKEKEPEEKSEDTTEKIMDEGPKKSEEEAVSPVVSDTNEVEKEKEEEKEEEEEEEEEEKVAPKESPSTDKPPEIEDVSPTAETEDESKKETPEEKQETTPISPMVNSETSTDKELPDDTFAVWSDKRKVCLLAKLDAVFSIVYSSQRGEEKAEVTIPKTANSKGKCGKNANFPVLQLSWGKNVFKMVFNKTDEENWALTSMELTYDTAEPLFDGAVNAGKKTARSKDITLFETPLKKSYFCPGQETILLYAGNKQVVTVRIRNLQLQPFEVEDGQFSPTHRCSKVVIDEETPYVQDETVPFAVGCTLALITLIILVGFSVHRAYHAAKVDYNSME